MMTSEINHQSEEFQAANHGHELGCFEIIAEEIVEDLEAAGVKIETGAFSEEIDGLTILERIILRLIAGEAECQCRDEEE